MKFTVCHKLGGIVMNPIEKPLTCPPEGDIVDELIEVLKTYVVWLPYGHRRDSGDLRPEPTDKEYALANVVWLGAQLVGAREEIKRLNTLLAKKPKWEEHTEDS